MDPRTSLSSATTWRQTEGDAHGRVQEERDDNLVPWNYPLYDWRLARRSHMESRWMEADRCEYSGSYKKIC